MKKLIIHAGIHRTGTTALQNALAASRETMREFGYCYPGNGANHQDWAWGLFRNERSSNDLCEYLKAESDGCHTIVLSGEDFAIHRDISWLDEVKREFAVQAYMTLRRQDDWLMSWYNQHVRWPFNRRKSQMTPYEFLQTIDDYYWLNYEKTTDLWAGTVGIENFKLSIMQPEQVKNFFSAVMPEIENYNTPKDNSSTSLESLEILRRLQVYDLDAGKRTKLIRAVNQVTGNKIGRRNIYNRAIRELIVNKFHAGNETVGRNYFSLNGSPFSNHIPDDYEGVNFSDEESRDLFMKNVPKIMEALMG